MVQLQEKLISGDTSDSARQGKHKLDELNAERVAKHLLLFRPADEVVEDLMAKARLAIPGLAKTETILKVLRYNPRCMFAISRKSRFRTEAPEGEGFIAILPLNTLGLQQLALNIFNGPDPDLRFIAKEDERPAGIYMWCVYAPGPLAAGMALFMREMAVPQYAGVNLYSRPNTEVGRRFNEALGTTKGIKIGAIDAPHLYVFPRAPSNPPYDSYSSGMQGHEIGVTVARKIEDLMRVAAIRSAVYIGEQECPYDEEYDGNDLSATHLLAYMGGEPVGCVRLRFFAGFAKLERLAIRKEFRKSRAAFELVWASLNFCRKKGYGRVYAHSQLRLVNFWNRFGFQVADNARQFVFSDFDYVEIIAELEPDPDALTVSTDPYVLIRPEGRWHVPGVLERSASRAATNPSVKDC